MKKKFYKCLEFVAAYVPLLQCEFNSSSMARYRNRFTQSRYHKDQQHNTPMLPLPRQNRAQKREKNTFALKWIYCSEFFPFAIASHHISSFAIFAFKCKRCLVFISGCLFLFVIFQWLFLRKENLFFIINFVPQAAYLRFVFSIWIWLNLL